MKLSYYQRYALQELKDWRGSPWCWKPATMRKLAAKGLVRRIEHLMPREAYEITEAGLAALLPKEPSE